MSDSRIVGAAGEYHTMCQLLRRGWIAGLVPEGTARVDILATNRESNKQCSLSVKTGHGVRPGRGWTMKKACERIQAPRLFYCFVDLGVTPADNIACYVVPSRVVAKVLTVSHQAWCRQPGKQGQARNADSSMRRFMHDYSRLLTDDLRKREPKIYDVLDTKHRSGWLSPFREAWHLLELE